MVVDVAAGRRELDLAERRHTDRPQWFGDSVTEDEWDDVWLSEGFATYFAALNTEHFSGREAFINTMTPVAPPPSVRSDVQRGSFIKTTRHRP